MEIAHRKGIWMHSIVCTTICGISRRNFGPLWTEYTRATGMSIEEYAEFLANLNDETLTYVISCGNMIASLSEEKQRVAYFFLRALSKYKS